MSTIDKLVSELNHIREVRNQPNTNVLTLTLQEEQILEYADLLGIYEEVIEKAY